MVSVKPNLFLITLLIYAETDESHSTGTMTDDEMLKMPVPSLQESGGLIFVWVTGRALELGRDCMRTWG
jgi:N6-adenosine-specific RNA methylase IME4